MEKILSLSASGLARKIKKKELKSIDVVEAHIERIKRVNPKTNAMVRYRFEEAREEAILADKTLRRSGASSKKIGVFHGVPCSIKECFSLTGMPNTSGVPARRLIISETDATAVSRYRAAGLIPLGVTNTSELCMWMETNNRVYGRTNNAYNSNYIAGGSSGGEGSIIGAGGAPVGLGSDIGGSIRMPAFFNGVFGHKPTGGLVPSTGQYPVSENEAATYLTTGPLARRAEDLYPLLKILAGPDNIDASVRSMKLSSPAGVKLKGRKVILVRDNGRYRVSAEMSAAQTKAGAALTQAGAEVVEESMTSLRNSLEIWSAMLARAGGASFEELMGQGEKFALFWQFLKWSFGKSEHTLPALSLVLIERMMAKMPRRMARFAEAGEALKKELNRRIGPEGLLLFPSYPTVAPRHNRPLLFPVHWVYTAIFNVLQYPVTQIPLGLDERGLPLGVQLVALEGGDHLTIAGALAIEKELGGWHLPAYGPD